MLRALKALFGGSSNEISPREARKKVAAKEAVDVRERDEWDEGHIPGAVHVPLGEFGEKAAELAGERDREVIVYCLSGGRSSRAAVALAGMGHPKVTDLEGASAPGARGAAR